MSNTYDHTMFTQLTYITELHNYTSNQLQRPFPTPLHFNPPPPHPQVSGLHRVATNLENMENLENSGNLKNYQNLRENQGNLNFCRKNQENSGKMKNM